MDELDLEAIARTAASSVARKAGKLQDLQDLEQEARIAIYRALAVYNPALSAKAPYLWLAARNACVDWIRATYGRYTRKTTESIGDRDFAYQDHALSLIEQQDSVSKAEELQEDYAAEDQRKDEQRAAAKLERQNRPPKPPPVPRKPVEPLTAGPYSFGLLTYERVGNSLIVKHLSGYIISIPLQELRYVLSLIDAESKRPSDC